MAENHTRTAAYEDPATAAELAADCRAADAALAPHPSKTPLTAMARAAARPAPSLRFEDYAAGLGPKEVELLAAARRVARELDL